MIAKDRRKLQDPRLSFSRLYRNDCNYCLVPNYSGAGTKERHLSRHLDSFRSPALRGNKREAKNTIDISILIMMCAQVSL